MKINSLNQESISNDSARELKCIIAIIPFILLSFEENIRQLGVYADYISLNTPLTITFNNNLTVIGVNF